MSQFQLPFNPLRSVMVAAASAALLLPATASALQVRVTVENLAPVNGTYLTPLWAGFHDGNFDLFDAGDPASAALERLAEDGNGAPLQNAFDASGAGSVQGTVLGPGTPPVFPPGAVGSVVLDLDLSNPASRYFSYAAMLIPSNDAFIANDNPLAIEVVDGSGTFLGASFFVTGSEVWDAGTEVNDEVPANTPLLGQMSADTGTDEGGVVALHDGFIPGGNILGAEDFANADFTQDGYPVAQIRVEAVPLPAAGLLLAGALVPLGLVRRRRAA